MLTTDRIGRITASRIAGVLGLSPYQSRADVLRAMVREACGAEPEFTGNFATEHGNRNEATAIADYEELRGVFVTEQDTVIHPNYPMLAATPDGLIGDDGLLEVKCPVKAKYWHYSQRPDYEAQMRLQLECTGRAWCDFAVWHGPGDLSVSRVEHDPEWLPSIMPTLTEFMAEFEGIIGSEELAAPFLAPLKDERRDPAWIQAATRWAEAKAAADAATAELAEAKAEMLEVAGDRPGVGAGVQVYRRKGARRVKWEAFAKSVTSDDPGDEFVTVGDPTFVVARSASE